MHDLLHSSNLCGIEYIYYPITAYRKLILKDVLSKVQAGDVLDLGCGQAGVYWSLAYAPKCRTICFFDYYNENLGELNRQLTSMSPEFIQENFADTYQFLIESGLIAAEYTSEQLAADILRKVDLIQQYDYRLLSTSRTFDTIISIEAIECVSSIDEFLSVLQVCYSLLKPRGQLLGVCSRYDQFNERTQELVDMRFGGALNPDEDELKESFIKSGFRLEDIRTVSTPELHNYSEAIIFDVRKN